MTQLLFVPLFASSFQGSSSTSLWVRNIQLGSYGMAFGIFTVLMNDATAVASRGFFVGYSPMVWLSISLNSLGGLAVAMVVKYTNNLVSRFSIVTLKLFVVFSFLVACYPCPSK